MDDKKYISTLRKFFNLSFGVMNFRTAQVHRKAKVGTRDFYVNIFIYVNIFTKVTEILFDITLPAVVAGNIFIIIILALIHLLLSILLFYITPLPTVTCQLHPMFPHYPQIFFQIIFVSENYILQDIR